MQYTSPHIMQGIYGATMTLYNESVAVVALPSALRTNGTVNGNTVDRVINGNPYEQVNFVILTGTITDGTHTFSFEDSPDGTTWTSVPTAQRQGALPAPGAANDDTVYEVSIISSKRYVRCNVVASGTTTGGVIGAVAILSDPSNTPTRT